MMIEIIDPMFKCEEDENVFFSRLYELEGYESVVGNGGNLYLTIKGEHDESVVIELHEICDIWNIRFEIIRSGLN